ncbi:hypothetical protein [Halioxenophilus sp. WMMB6]|uniref:hypothetical protein n=1 Tax=Halioxenophilus sp. WMMB6 TaxID=3073815 RepID=UPI00295E67CD|nr:hypothetical protein [Halioxenophilus sp. WMMB6]
MPSGGPSGGPTASSPGGSTTVSSGGASSPGATASSTGERKTGDGGDAGDENRTASSDSASGSGDQRSEQAPSLDDSESQSDDIDLSETTGGGATAAAEADSAAGGGGAATDSGSAGGGGPIMSAEERVAQMESVLQGSISDYDGMILKEREYIANRANARGSEDDLKDESSGPLFDEIGQPSDEGPGSAYETSSGSGNGGIPAGAPSGRPGDYQHAGTAPPPADIPSGSDDDVVARQIREAAMRETDPALREKLWDEYRKYKNENP